MSAPKCKVIGVGMFRTGTTTLGVCLERLGFRHHGFWGAFSYDSSGLEERLKENASKVLDVASKYDSFEDAPWLFLYKELDREFPGSKFILTLRSSAEKVSESERRWHLINGEKEQDIPNSDFFVSRYERHNEEVREYFSSRPDDLLEICWENGDGWEKLCGFLDVEVPRDKNGEVIPVPRANASHRWRKFAMDSRKFIKRFIGR